VWAGGGGGGVRLRWGWGGGGVGVGKMGRWEGVFFSLECEMNV